MELLLKDSNHPDIIYGESKIYKDNRGSFRESFNSKDLYGIGIRDKFVQDNISVSHANVLRGLHYQKEPMAQSKFITVIKGSITDFVVDIRENSHFYGDIFSYFVAEGSFIYIPVGFAHGFLSHEEGTIIQYKCSNFYSKEHEGGINPFSVIPSDKGSKLIVNNRDLEFPVISEFKSPF